MGTIPAVIVHTNGQVEMVNLDTGYKAIQSVVGGYFEAVTSSTGETTFWVNEEGKLIGLPMNPAATVLLWELDPSFAGQDFLMGTVLITGGVDDEGETLGVGAEGVAAVERLIGDSEMVAWK